MWIAAVEGSRKMKPENPSFSADSEVGSEDSKCAGRPARSRWCKSTTMKE
jgi:hypothetical protein